MIPAFNTGAISPSARPVAGHTTVNTCRLPNAPCFGAARLVPRAAQTVASAPFRPHPRSVAGGPGHPAVVTADPGAVRPPPEDHLAGARAGCGPEKGQRDGVHRGGSFRPPVGPDAIGEFVEGMVRFDVHGGFLPGY